MSEQLRKRGDSTVELAEILFPVHRIFLIDHAYTYRINSIREELEQLPQLVERLSRLMFIPADNANPIDTIVEHMWRFNHTYTLAMNGGKAEDLEPYWYIRDEFGSAIEHSDLANVRMAPFLSMIDGQMYTLLWLSEDIGCDGKYVLTSIMRRSEASAVEVSDARVISFVST